MSERWTEESLHNYLLHIIKPDEHYAQLAQAHSDQLTKPPGSLGVLERLASQLAAITGQLWPDVSKRSVIVMAGDHGVCEEGISAFPQSVTPQMVLNFLNGGAAVNVLATGAQADVVCVDIGVASDIDHPNLVNRKLKYGTNNIAKGAAMTREEAIEAIHIGIEVVEHQIQLGVKLFATGEMGIGNTTPSAAIVSVIGQLPSQAASGRGTGITDQMLAHKINIVAQAIAVNKPDEHDPLDVLSKLGGLEIAGLVGVILGAAKNRCPVVIDGYISTAAALVAAKLCPHAVNYMIASHQSHETGHVHALAAIGLKPMLQLELRVGEGTGAVLCFPFIDAALALMQQMATFSSAGVDGRNDGED